MKLLETTSLTIGYSAEKPLQKEIDFQINQGEIISLMGQNGVGKTTFIKTISGLIAPLSGNVKLIGDDLHALSRNQIAQRLSIVLTEKPFSLNMTVVELIALGRYPYSNWVGVLAKTDQDAVSLAIEETKVNYLAHRKLYELSDGQLQKVMIARALAQQTDLILLDEPTAHLDLYNKLEVMFLLRKIAALGKGIIISTHDVQISTQLSDKLWLFNFQEKAQAGVPEDLIINHTLEKALYLQDFGYDLVHSRVVFPTTNRSINVSGPDLLRFWTEQALTRNGYCIQEDATLEVSATDGKWILNSRKGSQTLQSIEALLIELKNHLD